jgi:HSP90 family molecular chaperone
MTDPIDEYLLSMLRTYKEYNFVNIASADIQLPESQGEKDEKKAVEKNEKQHKNFLAFVSTTIGHDKIEKVSF